MRFTQEHVDQWRAEGFVLIPEFFTEEELAPLRRDYERLYGHRGDGNGRALDEKEPGAIGGEPRGACT